MNKLYTAAGRLQFIGKTRGLRCPVVMLNNKEYRLDMQEMMLWSILNWRILSEEEIQTLYDAKSRETGYTARRPVTDCLHRLAQRGLAAEGQGETGADSLCDLLLGLYVIPISENLLLRLFSFIRLTLFEGMPYSVTRKLFWKDRRSGDEQKVMRLAKQAPLSTAEIIKCVQLNAYDFLSNEDLLDTLYHDEYTTSENIVHDVRCLSQCRQVITSVANLYLRKQIIFERI